MGCPGVFQGNLHLYPHSRVWVFTGMGHGFKKTHRLCAGFGQEFQYTINKFILQCLHYLYLVLVTYLVRYYIHTVVTSVNKQEKKKKKAYQWRGLYTPPHTPVESAGVLQSLLD